MSKKEYFAYGSNLNFEQMAYRCPECSGTEVLFRCMDSSCAKCQRQL